MKVVCAQLDIDEDLHSHLTTILSQFEMHFRKSIIRRFILLIFMNKNMRVCIYIAADSIIVFPCLFQKRWTSRDYILLHDGPEEPPAFSWIYILLGSKCGGPA